MSTPLRCAVIGCGVIAPAHIESYQRLENVEVTWLCDLVEDKAKNLAEKYNVPNISTDAAQVFAADDVDIVSICTDHASHAPLGVAAMEAGKHVICEKALAASTDGLEALCAAHARHPELKFGGIFQHRFDRNVRILKRLIEENAFGTILTANVHVRCLRTKEYYNADEWRGTWAQEGGAVLINQAIHFIDSLQWVMGGVKELSGAFANMTHQDVMETEDTAVATLRFHNGSMGVLEATCSSHLGWEYTLSVHGSEGSIDLRTGTPLKVSFADEEKTKAVLAEYEGCEDNKEIDAGKHYYGPSHPSQIEDFVQAVQENRDPFVTGESARKTVDLVLAIYESQRTGGWVQLP